MRIDQCCTTFGPEEGRTSNQALHAIGYRLGLLKQGSRYLSNCKGLEGVRTVGDFGVKGRKGERFRPSPFSLRPSPRPSPFFSF